MLTFLIPTAKEMAFDQPITPKPLSDKSSAIVQTISQLDTDDLVKLYKIKPEAAQTEAERWQELEKWTAASYPALHLFNGLMYRNIKRELTPDELDYVKQHVFITSALYGIIPALEPIAPHRLDFNTPLKVNGQSLKNYWRQDYDAFVQEDDTIISLLSSEFEAVFSPKIRQQLLTVTFMEEKNGQLKVHSTISKKARGQFLTAALEHNLDKIEDIPQMAFAGFRYSAELSTARQFVFIKNVS